MEPAPLLVLYASQTGNAQVRSLRSYSWDPALRTGHRPNARSSPPPPPPPPPLLVRGAACSSCRSTRPCPDHPVPAQDVAERIGREAQRRHYAPRVLPADAYLPSVASLPSEPALVFVASTTGGRAWAGLLSRVGQSAAAVSRAAARMAPGRGTTHFPHCCSCWRVRRPSPRRPLDPRRSRRPGRPARQHARPVALPAAQEPAARLAGRAARRRVWPGRLGVSRRARGGRGASAWQRWMPPCSAGSPAPMVAPSSNPATANTHSLHTIHHPRQLPQVQCGRQEAVPPPGGPGRAHAAAGAWAQVVEGGGRT